MKPPNVLLIVLDSVRAKNTSLHGYGAETTPFLESFVEEATTYTQARSPGVASVPSHTSMFTGLHVAEHGMRDIDRRLIAGSTIWEELAQDGYETGVFSYNSYLTQAPIGLADAFETVESGYEQRLPFPNAFDPAFLSSEGPSRYLEFLKRAAREKPVRSLLNGFTMWTKGVDSLPVSLRATEEVNGDVFTDLFFEWLADRTGPWAACVNYMDAHVPYLPRPEHNRWAGMAERRLMQDIDEHVWEFVAGERPLEQRLALESLYDGCIRQTDAEIERVIGRLRERGELDETLVVITSDHGEGFAEPGEVRPMRSYAHGNTGGLEEGLLHVPLVVRHPGQTDSERVERVASLTRFPDAVRQVTEGTPSEPCFVPDRGSVLAAMHPIPEVQQEAIPEYVEDYSPYVSGGEVVYEPDSDGGVRKYVRWRGETATLDCTDLHETEYCSAEDGGRVAEVYDSLSESDKVVGESTEVSDEVEERLAELGYR